MREGFASERERAQESEGSSKGEQEADTTGVTVHSTLLFSVYLDSRRRTGL